MIHLPDSIKKHIDCKAFKLDDIGMSGSQVLIFDDMVLKIQPNSPEARTECEMMSWMRRRVPVPEIIAHEIMNEQSFLLMSHVPGKMSCNLEYINDPDRLIDILCDGLRMLWNASTESCPVDASLDHQLAAAEYNVRNGLVDLGNVEPETFGENGFRNPEALLDWLKSNRPEEDIVLSHGDYCLPNIFADKGHVCGFIDLGRAGFADRYRDIAICYRSLKSNLRGSYGDHPPVDFDADVFFDRLGITPDWDKIRYFTLLDELF